MSLPDRKALFEDLHKYAFATDQSSSILSLLIMDIRRFRRINAIYGYDVGDRLLEQLFQRTRDNTREQDKIYRIGNNEFALLLPELKNPKIAMLAANKIVQICEQPFELNDVPLTIDITLGIASYPTDTSKISTLMRKAEAAVALAKEEGEEYYNYSDIVAEDDDIDWDIETELQSALDNGDLDMYYQPKIDLQTGFPYGAEALVRWRHPNYGMVPPDAFITVAEQTGKMRQLTWYCLNTALRKASEWPTRFGDLNVAVNLSPATLHHKEMSLFIKDSLSLWSFPPNRLTLEVTESGMMHKPKVTMAMLESFRKLGCKVSIDDFGTGYSSLAYFKKLPATELKIDCAFVKEMIHNPADQVLVTTMIHLAHGFNMNVVAEGVEDQATYKRLAELGCDRAQGYYMGKPMPDQAFHDWIRNYTGQKLS